MRVGGLRGLQLVDAVLYRVSPTVSDRLAVHRQVSAAVVPHGVIGVRTTDHFPTEYLGHEGVDLHESDQVARLSEWSTYQDLFSLLRYDREINVLGTGHCVENDWYETPDVEIYASMIGDFRPAEVIEIGAGYSTLVARRALEHLRIEARVTAIDPEPRRSVAEAADVVHRCRVEDIPPDREPFSDLGSPTLLFIDSSHVVRAGGDIPLLFNKLVPSLPSRTLVHVDDIYIPWDYPTSYRKRLYTEQYVLQALLCGSDRFRTVFASHYMGRRHQDLMRQIISPSVGDERRHTGSSYWFTVA